VCLDLSAMGTWDLLLGPGCWTAVLQASLGVSSVACTGLHECRDTHTPARCPHHDMCIVLQTWGFLRLAVEGNYHVRWLSTSEAPVIMSPSV
jgi:hypothetical protein